MSCSYFKKRTKSLRVIGMVFTWIAQAKLIRKFDLNVKRENDSFDLGLTRLYQFC